MKNRYITYCLIILVLVTCSGIILSCEKSTVDTITIDLDVNNDNTNDNDNVNRGTIPSSSTPTPSGTPTPGSPQEGLPIDLQGTPPEEGSAIVSLSKPSGATTADVTLRVLDPDNTNEGQLFINGTSAIQLFGVAASDSYQGTIVDITYSGLSADLFLDGANTFRFTHTATAGYRVDSISVVFN